MFSSRLPKPPGGDHEATHCGRGMYPQPWFTLQLEHERDNLQNA